MYYTCPNCGAPTEGMCYSCYNQRVIKIMNANENRALKKKHMILDNILEDEMEGEKNE